MKFKIGVEIHSIGDHSDSILKAIGNMNEGKYFFSKEDLESYLIVRNAMFPNCSNDLAYPNDSGGLDISRDKGKTISLSLVWKEIDELQPTNELDGLFESPVIDNEINDELTGKAFDV